MQNYEQICEELGIEIPEDKKAEFKKKMNENYKSKADYDKQVEKRDEYKQSLDDVQTKLEALEKEDVSGLKEQVQTLTTQLAEEKDARAKDAEKAELKEKVNDFLSDKKFVNALTEDAIRNGMLAKLEAEKGKNAEEVFKELTTKDGKEIENILVVENKEPEVKVPSFTSRFKSGDQKKGSQKLKEMSLDDRMKLKAEDPDYYATLANDK